LAMRSELETIIREEIVHVFGRRVVSSRDCIELSAEIYGRTLHQLNPNTLRRFFGLVKADYPASLSTLTILSKYCGFSSVDDISHNVKQRNSTNNNEIIEQESILQYFVSLFLETPVTNYHDKIFLSLVKHTIRFLRHNPSLADKFQCAVAKTKNGQDFYFEQFVNIDKLSSYYGDGLRYYLNEKRSAEAQVFVNSLFVYKCWLNDDKPQLLQHTKRIFQQPFPASSHSCINSRYYAAVLFHAQASSWPVEEILIDIYKFYSTLLVNTNQEQLFYFEYVLSEALVLTGHYHDALYYLQQFNNRQKKIDYNHYTISIQNCKILEAIAYYKTNDFEMAETIFNEIKPSGFHFINKGIPGIMYTFLANQLKRKNTKYSESFNRLISETGFKGLVLLLPKTIFS
jgi:hypothetical protein